MSNLNVQVCPETGICSIIKEDGTKVDLMPDEVGGLRKASGNPENIKQILAEVDSGFAESLEPEELDQISKEMN